MYFITGPLLSILKFSIFTFDVPRVSKSSFTWQKLYPRSRIWEDKLCFNLRQEFTLLHLFKKWSKCITKIKSLIFKVTFTGICPSLAYVGSINNCSWNLSLLQLSDVTVLYHINISQGCRKRYGRLISGNCDHEKLYSFSWGRDLQKVAHFCN